MDLSEFDETSRGYKIRYNAWVVRGFPRGEWVSEDREYTLTDTTLEQAQEEADDLKSRGLPERPVDATVVEYVLFEKDVNKEVAPHENV